MSARELREPGRHGMRLDGGWRFLVALLLIPVTLEGGCVLCVHREVAAAEHSVGTLFPLGEAPTMLTGTKLGFLDRPAAATIRNLEAKIGSVVTIHRFIAGSEPFGPCLVNITLGNRTENFRLLAYFYDGKCTKIEPVLQ